MKLDPKKTYEYDPGDAETGGDSVAGFEAVDGWRPPLDAHVTNWRKIEGEDVWMGTISVFGAPLHLYAIRVKQGKDGQVGTNDPYGRLDDMYHLDGDCCFAAQTIPGLAGEYVIYAHSFGE